VPRYFFDCDTGEHQFRDDVGIDLTDLKDVAAEAFGLLRDIVQGEMPQGLRTYTANVRDEHGHYVYRAEMIVRGQRFTSDD
jgi:hypothetical protein